MKDLQKEREYLKINVQTFNSEEDSLMQYILAYQTKSQMHFIREQIINYALKHGNEAAKNKFECHRNTVSKFLNRFKREGKEGLKNRFRAPKNIPHKIVDPKMVKEICEKRDETGYGVTAHIILPLNFQIKISLLGVK